MSFAQIYLSLTLKRLPQITGQNSLVMRIFQRLLMLISTLLDLIALATEA
nr:hypothetical protein [Piscirickettsia salmonis]